MLYSLHFCMLENHCVFPYFGLGVTHSGDPHFPKTLYVVFHCVLAQNIAHNTAPLVFSWLPEFHPQVFVVFFFFQEWFGFNSFEFCYSILELLFSSRTAFVGIQCAILIYTLSSSFSIGKISDTSVCTWVFFCCFLSTSSSLSVSLSRIPCPC